MARTPEQSREYNRRDRERHGAERNAKRRAQRLADPDKVRERDREYYKLNRERRLERARAHRARNGDKIRERQRARYAANKDQIRERAKMRRAFDPEKTRLEDTRRRHGLLPEDWAALWDAQDGHCYLCGADLPPKGRFTHVDHDHRCCPPGKSCSICRRGLACNGCNAAVGHANDDPGRLRRMADALEAANAAVLRRMGERGEQLLLYERIA